MSNDNPSREPATYDDPRMVDPMWIIDLAREHDRDVDDLLNEYNLRLPTDD